MAGDGKKYVVYGMRAKCSQGTMENYLTTDKGHGVIYQGNPLLNANDHVPQVNLTHFGDCKSRGIYEEAKRQANEKYQADADAGFFEKIGKASLNMAANMAITAKEYLGVHKCELDTPLPWMFVNQEHMIDGAPALTVESQCACRYGGIISIVVEEEEAENVELEQVDAIVSKYENKLIKKYAEEIEAYNFGDSDTDEKDAAAEKLSQVNIMEILQEMADEIRETRAVWNNKNDFFMFIDLVNTGQPLDLKNRRSNSPISGQQYEHSVWSLPWGDGNGGTMAPDYMGNWLYGYVGAEYFTTPDDDALLKYGAGAAQLWSDLKNKEENESYRNIFEKYGASVLSGNYGDNVNKGEKSDSQMIQEGIDVYRKANGQK